MLMKNTIKSSIFDHFSVTQEIKHFLCLSRLVDQNVIIDGYILTTKKEGGVRIKT